MFFSSLKVSCFHCCMLWPRWPMQHVDLGLKAHDFTCEVNQPAGCHRVAKLCQCTPHAHSTEVFHSGQIWLRMLAHSFPKCLRYDWVSWLQKRGMSIIFKASIPRKKTRLPSTYFLALLALAFALGSPPELLRLGVDLVRSPKETTAAAKLSKAALTSSSLT